MPDFSEPTRSKLERLRWLIDTQDQRHAAVLSELAQLRAWIFGLAFTCVVLLVLVLLALTS